MVRVVCLSAIALLAACEPEPGEKPVEPTVPPDPTVDTTDTPADTDDTDEPTVPVTGFAERTVDLGTARSGADGIVSFDVEILAGDTGFTLFGAAGELLMIERLVAPDGTVVSKWQTWWNGPRDLSDAFWPYYQEVSLGWPMRASDGEIQPGTWTVDVATVDADWDYLGGVDVAASARIRGDDDPATGTIRVALVWADVTPLWRSTRNMAGALQEEPGVADAVAAAVERWREVWAPASLTLELREVSSALSADMLPPWDPDSEVADAAALADDGEIVVLMGDLMGDSFYWYGVSGGVPGPLEVTGHSAILVSWLPHAGADAAFDADEIGLFGETLAHEVGHYVGLQHPVQSDYQRWDAIDDTVECKGPADCESQLGENIMFPYSICDADGCVDTFALTTDQIGQLQLAGATR